MRYFLILKDEMKVCEKKNFAIKSTKEYVDRFCDFCNKSEAYSIGAFCNEPEKYYNFIETIVMQCKMLIDPHFNCFHWFFTENIMTEELIRKLEDLQDKMLKSREDLQELSLLDGYIFCHFINDNIMERRGYLSKLMKSKLQFGLEVGNNLAKGSCSFVSEDTYLSNAYRPTSNIPLFVYEGGICIVYPDGSIRFAGDYQEYFGAYIEIGNIWTDDYLNDAIIKQRLEEFGAFLKENDLLFHNREFFCESVCSKFRVTKQGIYRNDQLMKAI